MNITPLSQRDPRWADVKVGSGALTFGEVGCLVTAATMLANAFGDSLTPDKANEKLLAAHGYSNGNLLVFASVQDMSAAVVMSGFIECLARPAPLDEINRRLDAGELAVVELRPVFNANTDRRHWVLLYEKNGVTYRIADPIDGKLKDLSSYGWGKWDSAMIITRAVFYKSTGVFQKDVITADGVRFRETPGGSILGTLPIGTPVQILDAGHDWTRVNVSGYVASQFIGRANSPAPLPLPPPVVVVPPPPVVVTQKARIGVNVLNRHEETALPLAARGCRFFNVLNNVGFASRLKREYPDAIVLVRQYWNKQAPSMDAYLAAMDGCQDKGLIYLGLNENDELGDDYMGIQRRFEWERGIASKLNELGATFAAGSFSMGSPNFLDVSICSLIKRLYAPMFNDGRIWWNHHLYSPNMKYGQVKAGLPLLTGEEKSGVVGKNNTPATWITTSKKKGLNDPIAPIWFETRWRFLFTDCGFENNGKGKIVSDETGMDEGGVGGFPSHGATSSQVAHWADWWRDQQSDLIQNKPSLMLGGAIFQVGNREDWAGYNVEGLLGEVKFQ